MKYIVKTTNIPDFTGIDAGGVAFANGSATVEDARMASWFREHDGYDVEEVEEENPLERMKVDELKAYAAEKNIDLEDAAKKDEIIEKIKAAKVTV